MFIDGIGGEPVLPQPGESDEQYSHRLQQALVATDWQTRLEIYVAERAALEHHITSVLDPVTAMDLEAEITALRTRSVGAAVLIHWADEHRAEQQQFLDRFSF